MMASDLSHVVATTQLTSVGDEGRRKSSELLAGSQDVSPTTTATSSTSTSTTTSSSSPVDLQLLMFLNSVEFHHDYSLVVLSANITDVGEKNNSNKTQTEQNDGETEALPEDCAADPFASSAPASASSFQSSAASSSSNNNNVAMVGSGSFGSILLCTPKLHKAGNEEHRGANNNSARRTSGDIPLQQCVVKVLSSLSGAEESAAAVAKSLDPMPNKDELAVLRQIGTHPHLLPLLDCYPMRNTTSAALATSQFQQQHALVFPRVSGGDLFDEVGLRGHYPEAQGRDLLFGLLQGLAQMHRAGIAHRDVKPENILLSPPTSSGQRPTHGILADFGLAGAVPAKDCCGSPLYAAPELLVATRNQKAYTAKVDLYSLGIVAYAVLTGGVPFCGTPDELFKHTLHSPPPFKARGGWSAVSSEGTEFVRLLLTKDPTKRPTAEEALAHPWFSGGLKHHHQKPPPLVQLATNSSPQSCKARTTSPSTPTPRVNCDRASSLTRSWYNKSKVERTSSCSVDGDELKVKKTLGHGSPPPFPKMGSVAGLRELYGGAATHAVVGVGMGASSSPCPGSAGEHSDDGLFTRHNSNSAPTLSLSPTPVQHITQATAEAGPTSSGDFDELGGARGTPLDG